MTAIPPQHTATPGARVGLGRSNAVVALSVLVFLVLVVGTSGYGAYTTHDQSARVLGYGIGAVFAAPLVMMLIRLPRLLSRRYVILDPVGLHIQQGREEVVLPWPEIVAVGIGYGNAPAAREKIPTSVDDIKDLVKDFLVDRSKEALQISENRKLALEIYPVDPNAEGRYPRLKPYWRYEVPPIAGLPDRQWRFPLPPVVSIGQAIEHGARTWQPQRWVGWFPRPWS
jgi:hypothetical protein